MLWLAVMANLREMVQIAGGVRMRHCLSRQVFRHFCVSPEKNGIVNFSNVRCMESQMYVHLLFK